MIRPSSIVRAVLCAAVYGGVVAASRAEPTYNDAVVFATVRLAPAVDTDGDGLTDDSEVRYGSDPARPDTDGDDLSDGDEVLRHNTSPLIVDCDGDGWGDGEEIGFGTDPLDPLSHPTPNTDTDGDGLPDLWELARFGTLSYGAGDDPDADGLTNAMEYALGSDPAAYDTDGDGMGDGNEIYYGHDPLAPHEPKLAFTAIEPQPDGSVRLRWSTMYGLGYQPQYKDDLAAPAWSNLVRHVIWEDSEWPGGEKTLLDRDAPKHPARFYRILTVDEE